MIVKLPWPHRNLSPNARTHWAALAVAKKRARHTAFWLTQEAMSAPLERQDLHVAVTFNPPNAVRRDLDNMLAACKAYFDGISDALGVDDSKWSLSISRGEPVKGGQVIVEVLKSLENTGKILPTEADVGINEASRESASTPYTGSDRNRSVKEKRNG